MLFDRECILCDYAEYDRLEWTDGGDAVICPNCAQRTFLKLPCIPGLVYAAGNGESALEMANLMDQRREKARLGHGNRRIKATANARGELTIDSIDNDK